VQVERPVVVVDVDADDVLEVESVEDEQPVEALGGTVRTKVRQARLISVTERSRPGA
jgi:hypothetical protein